MSDPDSGKSFQSNDTVYQAFIIDPADRIHITADRSASIVVEVDISSPRHCIPILDASLMRRPRPATVSPVNPHLLRTFTRRCTLSYKC